MPNPKAQLTRRINRELNREDRAIRLRDAAAEAMVWAEVLAELSDKDMRVAGTKRMVDYATRLKAARTAIPAPEDTPKVSEDTGRPEADGSLVSGPETVARVDIRRLAVAHRLAGDAAIILRHQREGDPVTEAEVAEASALKAEASEHRATVRSFAQDREDISLRRGRWAGRPVTGPARPFNSVTTRSPSGKWECPECGAEYDADAARRLGYWCKRKAHPDHMVKLREVWARPKLAERWAIVQARAEAIDGVEYQQVLDPEDPHWLRFEAVTEAPSGAPTGFGALLLLESFAPTGPRDPHLLAEEHQAHAHRVAEERAERRRTTQKAVRRADELRVVEATERTECMTRRVARQAAEILASVDGECIARPLAAGPQPSGRRTRRSKRGGRRGRRATHWSC